MHTRGCQQIKKGVDRTTTFYELAIAAEDLVYYHVGDLDDLGVSMGLKRLNLVSFSRLDGLPFSSPSPASTSQFQATGTTIGTSCKPAEDCSRSTTSLSLAMTRKLSLTWLV